MFLLLWLCGGILLLIIVGVGCGSFLVCGCVGVVGGVVGGARLAPR